VPYSPVSRDYGGGGGLAKFSRLVAGYVGGLGVYAVKSHRN